MNLLILPAMITLSSLVGSLAAVPPRVLGEFDAHGDIGSPARQGSATYDAAAQEYTVSGAGTNMWQTRDQFHFIHRPLSGNFLLRTRFEWLTPGVDPHRKAGWMARESLDPEARYVDCAVHGDGLTSIQFRRVHGGPTEQIVLPSTNGTVLQFERRGNTFIFSVAAFGETFVSGEIKEFELSDSVQAGLFVCSHNGEVIETAKFRDVRIIRPVRQGFTPYRDYIGSVLEILDVHSGRLEKIHQSKQPFEAPNWTVDGKALIYNNSGRAGNWGSLVRFDLATRTPVFVNTGFANRNNNDHVLSFDGSMLGISDQSAPGGESTIYTLSATGGIPKRITPRTPSYLHGWSPDGKWLVYTGGRSSKYDIYKIRSDGGSQEVRLTDSPGLNDGPEFTPDGKYIYFNSTRGGRMQLWRMKPDGSEQEQVTNDEFNNWFPHISPDGKWIVFISFPGDIDPRDHPYYKQCYLRLMPFAGGTAKVIAYVYGGQGTINVPSWSPDSRRIAFVTNSDLTED
ncbi:MAG TPA: biopolymer transporter TolR [Verrucomicrobiae bacterium]|nr:biopolymer transporter TolR [Verrucomicrobiae bacterium]